MLKNIKKSLKYLIIITGVIIMLPTVLYIVLQISQVQTFLIKRITNHFSSEFRTTISVGHVEYKFFNKLLINDILIKDKNKDTLIYAQRVTAGLKRFDFFKKSIRLGRVVIVKPVVSLVTDSSGLMNLTWYLDLLKNPSDTLKSNNDLISIDQIDISDARFSLINYSGTRAATKIDFNNLKLSGINGILEDIRVQNDTTSFNIYNLGFKESNGFLVKRMNSSMKIVKEHILFNSTFLNCDSSILNIPKLWITADSSASFKRFTEEVKLDILLERSLINTSDLQYFMPFANGLNESVWISGKVLGTVSELRGRNIELIYRDSTYLDCDFDLSGLPKIENAFIYIGVNNLRTNARDIERIKIAQKGYIVVPKVLQKLGNISFSGSFTGFTTDFVTYGEFRTNLGNISTDISLRPEASKKYKIKGLLTGTNINIGKLTDKSELLGKLSMQSEVDGYAYSLKKFAAKLTGKIDSIEINKYEYRNIDLNGSFTEKTWDGSIKVVDSNINLDLLGSFNFTGKLPEFDFTLNLTKANLYKLNIDKIDTTASLAILLTSNFKGTGIDNLDGEIRLLNSSYKKFNNNLELYDFSIKTYLENNNTVLSLRTDFVDADVRGHYNFATIGGLFKSTLSTLMPSQFPMPVQSKELNKNNFTFQINFKNTDKINLFFRTGVLIADKSYLNGSIFPDSVISISGKAKSVTIKNNIFSDFSIDANILQSELSVGLSSSTLSLLGSSELKGFNVSLKTKPDTFIFNLNWDNKDKNLNRVNILARGAVVKNNIGKGNAILKIEIDSTDVFSRNNQWKISKSSIIVDSNAININKLYISNADNYYLIDGTISENQADTLHLGFKGIDIAPLNYIVNKNKSNDPNYVFLDIKGRLNGKILLTNVYKNLLLEGYVTVNNYSMLGSSFGNVSLISAFDVAKKVVNITASNNLGGIKMFDVKGYYDPTSKKVNLAANAKKMPIDALNPLLKIFASDIKGVVSGKLKLTGESNNLVLSGAVMAENASMKIDYLQTYYKVNDTIRFDKNGIKFNNVKFADEKGNIALLTGTVNHKSFKDFGADLIINMNANECLVLNTKPKDNELFYGTAYASGLTTIKSGLNSLTFDISAKTGKNTKFIVPLNKGLSVSESSFISFVDMKANNDEKSYIISNQPTANTTKTLGMDLNFDLEVTPEAEVQLIFDSKVGDVMKGRGSGNLNISMNRKGDFKMSGDYIIEDGDYLFTLGNLLNKSFSVENGGRIIFNGDLANAEIEIKAIYKLKASLFEILQDERFNERIPVECQLNLSGKLFNPVVAFNIYLPSSDEETRTYLKNAISTEEELSRQFLYLLVMNSFYADQSYRSNASATTTTGTSAISVTTTEMLSNQLSNWLSQISNDFDIGFLYRPGTGALNPQEVQVALSTQLLNNKVVINGNFDVRGTGSSSGNANQITGDFDAEYRITDRIRFKVFNRYNNPYTGLGVGVPYTQGIGILFKQDFDRFSDFLKGKMKADLKKEDVIKIKKK
jgi:hypothetical protein